MNRDVLVVRVIGSARLSQARNWFDHVPSPTPSRQPPRIADEHPVICPNFNKDTVTTLSKNPFKNEVQIRNLA